MLETLTIPCSNFQATLNSEETWKTKVASPGAKDRLPRALGSVEKMESRLWAPEARACLPVREPAHAQGSPCAISRMLG